MSRAAWSICVGVMLAAAGCSHPAPAAPPPVDPSCCCATVLCAGSAVGSCTVYQRMARDACVAGAGADAAYCVDGDDARACDR